MALVVNDRVKETTTTTGTGTVTLGGAVSGFDTFAAGIGNSNTTYYCIQLAAEFEVGLGTLAGDSSTLARTTVISSSNSDNAVDFSAGAKNVFCTLPASKATVLDASGNLTLAGAVQLNSTFTVGANDQGYDVTLHGDTASRNVVWDSSADSLIFTDNAKAIFGAGSDLQVYHDGSNSYVDDAGTGTLNLRGSDFVIISRPDGSATSATFDTNGPVGLRYNNSTKIETTNTGVNVTGVITASGIVTANAKLDMNGTELILDADADTSITSDTDDQIDIKVGGTDSISITPSQVTITDADSSQPRLLLKNTNADTSSAFLDFQKDSASPANDNLGIMRWIGDDAGGNTVVYATIFANSPDVTDGSEDGSFSIQTIVNGTNATRLSVSNTIDIHGNELILDADNDTSITADTDDKIDYRIGGADVMQMNATAFSGGAIYENADDITANYSITAGKNALSVGPITIASGVTVTVPSGQRWVIL